MHVHPVLISELLALVLVANGTPLLATKVFGSIFDRPLDGGITLPDGRRLFGRSKTIRGALLSLLATTLIAPWLGLSWTSGLLVAALAMAGDLASSFIKRRLGFGSGSMALGLDQIPEAFLPAAGCRFLLPITLLDILLVTALFFALELAASRALYALNIRETPY